MSANNILIDGLLYDGATGELINKLEQVEVEIVEDNLPEIVCNGGTHIQTNTEQLKKELIIYLKKFDIEVTAETEKEASKKATELNKLAKDLNSKRLAVGKEIKKPADELKNSIDSLIEIVQDKRTSILDGVEVFKSKRFEIIRGLLNQNLQKLYIDMNVSERYQVVDIEPLVVEGSLGKSNLSKKAIEALESQVRKVKALEDAVTIRTLQLEVTCVNKGLEFAIEFKEIENIIEEDNYDLLLNEMIDSRLELQERYKKQEAERKLQDAKLAEEKRLRDIQNAKEEQEYKIQLEKDNAAREIQRVKEEALRAENERLKAIEDEKQRVEQERLIAEQKLRAELEAKTKQEEETGTKIVMLQANFQVEVPLNIDGEKVRLKFQAQLEQMFTTLTGVEVV